MIDAYKYKEITEQIIGAAIEVHNTLGCGFQEVVYQRALQIEFAVRFIENEREYSMQIYYEGTNIGTRRVDFLVNRVISVEIKAVEKLEDVYIVQAKNNLVAFNLEIGLLINFSAERLEFHRLINSNYKTSPSSA